MSRKRKKELHICLSDNEFLLLEALAEKEQMSYAELFRYLLREKGKENVGLICTDN